MCSPLEESYSNTATEPPFYGLKTLRKRNKRKGKYIWDAYRIIYTSHPCKALIIIKTYNVNFMAHYSDVAHKSCCGLNALPRGDMGAHAHTTAASPSFMEITTAAGFDKCASITPCPLTGSKSQGLPWERGMWGRVAGARPGLTPSDPPASLGEQCGQRTRPCFRL